MSANNAVVGPDYPYLITADWGEGNRSDRITELLASRGRLDVAAMRAIQSDTLNPIARKLVPILTNETLGTGGPGLVRWALNQSPIEMPGGTDAVGATRGSACATHPSARWSAPGRAAP